MIRENPLFCKLIRIKSSSKALFGSFMAGFHSELQTCPCCGARGSCSIHAYYDRSLVDNLMTNALTLGAQMEKKVIDTEVILASVSSQNLG